MSRSVHSTRRAGAGLLRRLRGERGFSLVELTMAMAIMLVVLGATLAPFEFFQRGARKNGDQNQAQDTARLAINGLVREVRNVAGQSQFVEKAAGSDLVFQTVDGRTAPGGTNSANVERIRYCLNTGTKVLWRQVQTWTTATPPALPSTSSCPDGAWPVQKQAVGNVTNGSREIFSYDTATLSDIAAIQLTLFVDVNSSSQSSPESELTSSAYLRNQNKKPIASFSATPTGNKHVQLNGSASSDPEGGSLTYKWFDGSTFAGATQMGTGQSCDCVALATGTRTIWLQVADPSGLLGDVVSQAVVVQ